MRCLRCVRLRATVSLHVDAHFAMLQRGNDANADDELDYNRFLILFFCGLMAHHNAAASLPMFVCD